MRITEIKEMSCGAVNGSGEVTISATKEEIEEFIKALKVVEKFKHMAKEALKVKEKMADWTMYNYDIWVTDKRVVVKIEQGACG